MIRVPPIFTLFPYTTLFRSLSFVKEVLIEANYEVTPASTGEEAVREAQRSEEHTSEFQSRGQLVCRLLLEKKNFFLTSSIKKSIFDSSIKLTFPSLMKVQIL